MLLCSFTIIIQATNKKPPAKENPKVSDKKTTTAAKSKGKQTTGKKTTRKSKKTVTFSDKSCRRSLCFSDDEECSQNDATTTRMKRDAAKVTDGFYKEKAINSKMF